MAWRKLVAASAAYGTDVLFIVGLALLAWGLGWIYLPLAPATVGVVFVAMAVIGARKPQRLPRKPEDE